LRLSISEDIDGFIKNNNLKPLSQKEGMKIILKSKNA